MLFWTSFLVFIASILIYILLPARTDQISLDHYRDDPLMISFVNQHQAAKDYAEQMIMWKTSGEQNNLIHPFDTEKLEHFMPKGMQDGYNDIGTQADIGHGDDAFVSGMICLDSNDNMAECNGDNNSFIITYGYVPGWWDINNMKRQGRYENSADNSLIIDTVWLKPMLRRTHGSTVCGVLKEIGATATGISLYAIDNGQAYKGFRSGLSTGQKILPVGTDSDSLNGTTGALIGDRLSNETSGLLPDASSPIFICMSPYQNPYVQTPLFHWDIANNKAGHAHQNIGSSFGDALVGGFSGKTLQCGGANCAPAAEYTLSVTVKAGATSGNLMKLNSVPDVVKYTCGGATCNLEIGALKWENIPANKPFSFTYTGSSASQKLNVFYCKAGEICPFKTTTWKTSNTAAPTLSGATLESQYLVDVLLYDTILSDREVAQNNKVNHRRFGI